MQMELREANQQFSRLVKAVKQGKEVLLPERGKPLAVMKLIEEQDIRMWSCEGLKLSADTRGIETSGTPSVVCRYPAPS